MKKKIIFKITDFPQPWLAHCLGQRTKNCLLKEENFKKKKFFDFQTFYGLGIFFGLKPTLFQKLLLGQTFKTTTLVASYSVR